MKKLQKIINLKNLIFLSTLITSICLNSCTKSLVLRTPLDQADKEMFNQKFNKQLAQIEVGDSSIIDNVFLTFNKDSLIFQNVERSPIEYKNIRTITIVDKRRALQEGFTNGLIFGSAAGLILGAASVTFTSKESRLERGIKGAAVYGIIWSAIGWVAGKQSDAKTIITIKSK